jgi:diguanylate cyclase (GGDEF)-like protein
MGEAQSKMFRQLRTKLTVLYAGLFSAALILVSLAVYAAISGDARGVVRGELLASGAAFDRIWEMRTGQLQASAALLSRDFGFREAVATRDEATIRSALENLRRRMGIDMAFIIGVDGQVIGGDPKALSAASVQIMHALDVEDMPSGVLAVGGTPYQTIAAPVLSPTLVGWVVFASKLDKREMNALGRLSSIPLDATVVSRADRKVWTGPAGSGGLVGSAAFSRLIESALATKAPEPREFKTSAGVALTLVKPLKAIGDGAPAALVLSYPLARAMAPYQPLLATIVLTGALGVALMAWGSWILARSVTRPISVLDEAAHRLERGEDAEVKVETRDELGRLAASFNAMASEIRDRERRITDLALRDAETNLPNRLSLERAIEGLASEAAARGERVAFLAMGVDRFTHVRGAIGYTLAGQMMAGVGTALQLLRPRDLVGHFSNGLVGVAFSVADLNEARLIGAQLQKALESPVNLDDTTVDVTLTVGLAVYPDHTDHPDQLINLGSVAVDQARDRNRRLDLFDAKAYGDPAVKLSLMSDMLKAIDNGEIYLNLQPKFDLRQARTTGVEALVRWRHPVRGVVTPDEFIPLAEETGHIRALTDHVLAAAIREQAMLAAAGHVVSMSVNVSGRLVGDLEFAEECLRLTQAAAGEICLEITETAVIDNPEMALQIIDRFASAGLKISIDDYGSGLSSLAYLKQIRAHELKIDKAFVMGMNSGQKDVLLVRSTIDLAHSLGLQVTAEGVETDVAQALLAGMGCDLAQGYLIARPMMLADLLEFLDQEAAAAVKPEAGPLNVKQA